MLRNVFHPSRDAPAIVKDIRDRAQHFYGPRNESLPAADHLLAVAAEAGDQAGDHLSAAAQGFGDAMREAEFGDYEAPGTSSASDGFSKEHPSSSFGHSQPGGGPKYPNSRVVDVQPAAGMSSNIIGNPLACYFNTFHARAVDVHIPRGDCLVFVLQDCVRESGPALSDAVGQASTSALVHVTVTFSDTLTLENLESQLRECRLFCGCQVFRDAQDCPDPSVATAGAECVHSLVVDYILRGFFGGNLPSLREVTSMFYCVAK